VRASTWPGSQQSALQNALRANVIVLLNLVERFFADLTEDVVRSGSFTSVKDLVDDINAYLAERNANPKPYRWTAKGEEIIEKIRRARVALEKAEAHELHKAN
jgi:hypothetical protein